MMREVCSMVLARPSKLCNFLDYRDGKVVYKRCDSPRDPARGHAARDAAGRYASLYFIMCIDKTENELETLEGVHHFVEVLDRYFGNVRRPRRGSARAGRRSPLAHSPAATAPQVCELDIIFNFHKAYYVLDELMIGGHLAETSKKEVLRVCAAQDSLMDEVKKKKERGRK